MLVVIEHVYADSGPHQPNATRSNEEKDDEDDEEEEVELGWAGEGQNNSKKTNNKRKTNARERKTKGGKDMKDND